MAFYPHFPTCKERFKSSVSVLQASNCHFRWFHFHQFAAPATCPLWASCYCVKHNHHHPMASRSPTCKCCQAPAVRSCSSIRGPGSHLPKHLDSSALRFHSSSTQLSPVTKSHRYVYSNSIFSSHFCKHSSQQLSNSANFLVLSVLDVSLFNSLSPSHELESQTRSIWRPFLPFSSDSTLNKSLISQGFHFLDWEIITAVPTSLPSQVILKLNWDDICQVLRTVLSTKCSVFTTITIELLDTASI